MDNFSFALNSTAPIFLVILVAILWMHHATEGEAGQRPELFLICASVDVEYGFVSVNQSLGFLRAVDEKSRRAYDRRFPR